MITDTRIKSSVRLVLVCADDIDSTLAALHCTSLS